MGNTTGNVGEVKKSYWSAPLPQKTRQQLENALEKGFNTGLCELSFR